MYVSKEAREYVECYKGLKRIAAKICIKINGPLIRMLNWEFDMVRKNLEKHDGYFERLWNIEIRLKDYERIAEKVQNMDYRLKEYELAVKNMDNRMEEYERAAESIENINRRLEEYGKTAEDVERIKLQLQENAVVIANAKTDHIKLDKIEDTIAMYRVKTADLQKILKQNTTRFRKETESHMAERNGNIETKAEVHTAEKTQENAMKVYDGMDYFDFENHFRGTMAQIRQNQAIYLKYFTDKVNVIDLGCGRGEFLELLKENGIHGRGVDMYQEFVDLCITKELEAVQGDAVEFLEHETQVDGIFAAQIIEHLTLQQLIRLIDVAYEKLAEGCYLIMETPNPTSLSIYTHAFYTDPSHDKPRHPLTMRYLLEKAGFREIDVIFTESSKVPVKIPELKIKDVEGIDRFNEAMREVEQTLYGSQDYAVIAKK